MAFKMKNPSLMKMAKAAGDNRTAMKMKKESPMKAEGKPSDTSKDNVKQAKDLVKEMKKQRNLNCQLRTHSRLFSRPSRCLSPSTGIHRIPEELQPRALGATERTLT